MPDVLTSSVDFHVPVFYVLLCAVLAIGLSIIAINDRRIRIMTIGLVTVLLATYLVVVRIEPCHVISQAQSEDRGYAYTNKNTANKYVHRLSTTTRLCG